MKLGLLLVAAVGLLALAACGPTKTAQLGQCQVDANKTFPNGPDVERREHIRACMAAHDYEWVQFVGSNSAEFCGPDPTLLAYEPNCYRRIGAVKRASDH